MWNITAHVLQLGLSAKFIEPVGTLKALPLVVLAPGSSLPTTDPSAVIPGERSETRDSVSVRKHFREEIGIFGL